jgi:hypothetical protein
VKKFDDDYVVDDDSNNNNNNNNNNRMVWTGHLVQSGKWEKILRAEKFEKFAEKHLD